MSEVDQKDSTTVQHDERAGLSTAEAEALYATVIIMSWIISSFPLLIEIYWIGWI